MLTRFINFKNPNIDKKFFFNNQKNLKQLIKKKSEIIKSLSSDYKSSYDKKIIFRKYKRYKEIRLIGMGGSILGAKAIHSYLHHKIKKNFYFIDNLNSNLSFKSKKIFLI